MTLYYIIIIWNEENYSGKTSREINRLGTTGHLKHDAFTSTHTNPAECGELYCRKILLHEMKPNFSYPRRVVAHLYWTRRRIRSMIQVYNKFGEVSSTRLPPITIRILTNIKWVYWKIVRGLSWRHIFSYYVSTS